MFLVDKGLLLFHFLGTAHLTGPNTKASRIDDAKPQEVSGELREADGPGNRASGLLTFRLKNNVSMNGRILFHNARVIIFFDF